MDFFEELRSKPQSANFVVSDLRTSLTQLIQLSFSVPWQRGRIFRPLRKNRIKTKVSVQIEYPEWLSKIKPELVNKGNDLASTLNGKFRFPRKGRSLTLMTKFMTPNDPGY